MAATLVVPDEVIKAKKCFLCENILSVPPIMAISLEVEQYKCGRCKDVNCTSYTRNNLYESVASFIWFTCTYNKCTEKIPWGLVEQHEKECQFRTMQCPIYYQKCNAVVETAKLKLHFEEKHKNNVKNCNEVWDLNTKFDYVFLIIEDGLKFLVYILHLNDLFSMGVLSIDPITKYKKYTVKLSTVGVDECSILYENQNIVHFDERKHCYRCIRSSCQTKYHPYAEKNKKSEMNVYEFTKKFRKDLITNIAQNEGELKYIVNLIPDESKQKTNGTSTRDEQTKQDLLRKSVACPICEEYMVAPIFSCTTGHTICNVCKPRLQQCPTCQAELSNSRNFTLEELTENIKLTCQYEGNGCNFVGNTEKMFTHEANCTRKSNTTK